MKFASQSRKSYKEVNTGRSGRGPDDDVALVGRKHGICGMEEVGLQLFEEMVAVCSWRWSIVLPAPTQRLRLPCCSAAERPAWPNTDLTFTAARFGWSWITRSVTTPEALVPFCLFHLSLYLFDVALVVQWQWE